MSQTWGERRCCCLESEPSFWALSYDTRNCSRSLKRTRRSEKSFVNGIGLDGMGLDCLVSWSVVVNFVFRSKWILLLSLLAAHSFWYCYIDNWDFTLLFVCLWDYEWMNEWMTSASLMVQNRFINQTNNSNSSPNPNPSTHSVRSIVL